MSITVTPIPRLSEMAAPALTLGTSNAAGTANTVLSTDSTLLAFDATLPDAITLGQSGAAGSATVTARRDHAHAMAALDVPLTAIDIDGGTDIGAAIVDADLFIVDDNAGGTNRKTTAERIKVYVGERTIARKTSDESIPASTSLQNDDALEFSIAANEEWLVSVFGFVDGMDTGGMKMGWSLPTGGTQISNLWLASGTYSGGSSTSIFAMGQTGTGIGVPTGTLADEAGFTLYSYIKNGTNAGTVNYQWAQFNSNGTATTLEAGSTLIAQRIV